MSTSADRLSRSRAAGAEAALQDRLSAEQAVGNLPSLHSLSIGWGFGGAAMQTLASASQFLTELSTGVGAEVSDWSLACLATACPHLQALRLQFATITDAGVLATRLISTWLGRRMTRAFLSVAWRCRGTLRT